MKTGEVIQLHRDEQITCVRSASSGGRFVFDLRLGAGVDGPPMHSHAEGPEVFEVVSGTMEFRFADGEVRTLRPGDRLEIAAGRAHTFRNPSKTEAMFGRGEHGPRFERSMDQFSPGRAGFARMCRYVVSIDRQATYMQSWAVRAVMRLVALVARLRRIETV